MIKLSDLTPHPDNPRKITDAQMDKLKESIRRDPEYMQPRPLVVNQDNIILAGNQRWKALQALGHDEIPEDWVRFVDWDEEKSRRFVIMDNHQSGEWDEEVLLAKWTDLDLDDLGLELDVELEPEPGLTDPDDVPEPPEEPVTRPGDLWVLGEHRLLCGDCTQAGDIDRLMQGETADLLLTDPPYNVGIEYGSGVNDSKTVEQNEDFIKKWFGNFQQVPVKVITPGAGYYLGTLRSWLTLFPPRWMCIWVRKNSMSHSPLRGFQAWEPMLFYKNEEDDADSEWGGALVYGKVKKSVKQDVFTIPVGIQKDVVDEKGRKLHPTPKPRELFLVLLRSFSKEKQVVVDPFLGSGTTIIACEQLNRRCRAIEISPVYVDVAIIRWQNFTGRQAVHAETGKTFGG